jgi:hypothetical protein
MTPKVQETRTEIGKWDYIKLKSFGTAEEMINRVKRQLAEWEKVFDNYLSDRGLISTMYKEF